MASTMDRLLLQLRHNPTDIKPIAGILEELLETGTPEQAKLDACGQLTQMLTKMLDKISPQKQAQTYNYLGKLTVRLLQILFHCLSEGQQPQAWLEVIGKVLQMKVQQQQRGRVLAQFVLRGKQGHFGYMKSGEMVLNILQALSSEFVDENMQKLLDFLLNLQHFKQLEFQLQATATQMKRLYQEKLIKCLDKVSGLEMEKQVQVYHRLGQRVFSKLASPLYLSEFLLGRFASLDEHPAVQIEVLSCLFILVGKYGLELEKFYENLQMFMERERPGKSLFRLKNSKRLLKLVEAALRSSKVPFKDIISLTKILLERVLNQKSELTFWILSFLVNLVKKHRQLQSHLKQFPELEALKYHYSPKIRSLVKQLSKNLNKSEYLDIEDFSKINLQKLCDRKLQEITEKIEANEDQLEFKLPSFIDYL